MSDYALSAGIFAVLALVLGWLCAAAIKSGEIPTKYGFVLTRTSTPRRFWFLVGLMAAFAVAAAMLGVSLAVRGLR